MQYRKGLEKTFQEQLRRLRKMRTALPAGNCDTKGIEKCGGRFGDGGL